MAPKFGFGVLLATSWLLFESMATDRMKAKKWASLGRQCLDLKKV